MPPPDGTDPTQNPDGTDPAQNPDGTDPEFLSDETIPVPPAPTQADYFIDGEPLEQLDDADIDRISVERFSQFDDTQLRFLNDEAFDSFAPEQFAALPLESLDAMEAEQIENLPPDVIKTFLPAQIQALSDDAIAGFTPEQFEQLPIDALNGLKAEQIGELDFDVLADLSIEEFNQFDVEEMKTMPHADFSRFVVQVDQDKITADLLLERMPEGWQFDNEGNLQPPENAELFYQALPEPVEGAFFVPEDGIPNLDSYLGLGANGSGDTPLAGFNRLLDDISPYDIDFDMQQNTFGILDVSEKNTGLAYAFSPDREGIRQGDSEAQPGLSQNDEGYYVLTTEDKKQFTLEPAPSNPGDFVNIYGADTYNEMSKDSAMIMEFTTVDPHTRRAGRSRRVTRFDPQVEPLPLDALAEAIKAGNITIHNSQITSEQFQQMVEQKLLPDNFRFGFQNAWTRRQAQNGSHTVAPIKRPFYFTDGRMQQTTPGILAVSELKQILIAITGMESVKYYPNGALALVFLGQNYAVLPQEAVYSENFHAETSQKPTLSSIQREGEQAFVYYRVPHKTRNKDKTLSRQMKILRFRLDIVAVFSPGCQLKTAGEWLCQSSISTP